MKELLYNTFRGNNAGITERYGMEMEETARIEYTAHQQRTKCTKLTTHG